MCGLFLAFADILLTQITLLMDLGTGFYFEMLTLCKMND